MARRGAWATRLGIYMAAIGSAFGLGGLWRFPYIVSENGGGAFVVIYFVLLSLIGLPLLVGELLIGKATRRGVLAGQKQLAAQAQSQVARRRPRILIRIMPILAILSLIACIFILGYYSVLSGWILHFLFEFLSLPFVPQDMAPDTIVTAVGMGKLKSSGLLQFTLALIHITAVSVVVAKGVEDGIERWVGFIMPIFVGILAVLVFKSVNMGASFEALRYFLYPDFSKLNYSSLGAAIGQLCFTLSIGFATMVTFGSYLRDDASVPLTGLRVAMLDSTTALVAGLLIFPLVVGGAQEGSGIELLFTAVPRFLLQLNGGVIFGIFFFICLYLAALGASISILETVVANLCENTNFKRGHASLIAGGASVVACIVPALSSSLFQNIQISGHGVLQIIDYFLIHWVVPLLALIYSQIVVYEVPDKMKRDEFIGFEGASGELLYEHWRILMKWIVPPIIILAMLMQGYDLILRNSV